MHAEDSSSVSAKFTITRGLMVIRGIKQVLHGAMEITADAEPAFFLRPEYLEELDPEKLFEYASTQTQIPDEEAVDIQQAALTFSTEKAAMSYLARCEHCRRSLEQKLTAKQMDAHSIKKALDYLESCNFLSDRRFALAWLRTRAINHYEGRIRLNAELASRGVEKNAIREALDEFFQEYDEEELCSKAAAKYTRTHPGTSQEKMRQKMCEALNRMGFSSSTIRKIL